MGEASWTCRCGDMRMTIRDVPAGGAQAVCYCHDCRTFAHLHDAGDRLDPAGGVALYTTTSDRVEITQGAEHLACERLTSKGPYRWYARCCGTPVGNGSPRMGVPFFSVQTAWMTGGPERPLARLHRGGATGKVPKPHGNTYALVLGVAKRLLSSRFSGRWKDTPFFDAHGRPVSDPGAPDADALRAARSAAR